jgi:rubrerythrin
MPQTPPFHGTSLPRKLSDAELARALRLDLESELDAINLYAAHLEATENPTARAVLRHVMDEEREHAALFWALIGQLDPSQASHAREAAEKLELLASGASDDEVEAAGQGRVSAGDPAARGARPRSRVTRRR